ncbi:MAG TPA: CAAX prenyl protease-related protein, partial [Silvibacterium sp.]|nr:CAAX prenyl protease-related protein [Silvibacterium sp.]
TSEGASAEQGDAAEVGESPATIAYLVPFLAILAASVISKAASGSFERLYPLRFIAGICALWFFRKDYRKLDWRFDWLGPTTGVAIFFLWIAPTLWTRNYLSGSSGSALALLSPILRTVWIATHVAAAIITAPIAEELAFRGYLVRRLISRNFDMVPFSSLSFISIGLSSIAFGLMQGSHWIVGTLAGASYALVAKRRGRIGDAIVAHAMTNLLLAAWVLLSGNWAQW